MQPQNKSNLNSTLVCLYSDANFLALNVLESLLSHNCFVNIVCGDVKDWETKTQHLSRNKFSIIAVDRHTQNHYSYAIFVGGFINPNEGYSDFVKFNRHLMLSNTKTIAVFPFEIFSNEIASSIRVTQNSAIVYVGDLLGPRLNIGSGLLIPSIIGSILETREMNTGPKENVYPIFVSDAGKLIVKWLLSFGPYGKEVLLLGPETPISDFYRECNRLSADIKVVYDTDITPRIVPKFIYREEMPGNLRYMLTETFGWFSANHYLKQLAGKAKKVNKKKKMPESPAVKAAKRLISIVLLIYIAPMFLTLLAGLSLAFSFRGFVNGKTDTTINLALFSRTLFAVSNKESQLVGHMPLFGYPHKENEYVSSLGLEAAEMVEIAVPLSGKAGELFNKALGDSVYDVNSYSIEIDTYLKKLYEKFNQAKTLTERGENERLFAAGYVARKIDFGSYDSEIKSAIIFVENLDDLFGRASKKSYLILLQNNMELRPTGGFIGSYGVAVMDGGRLSELTVNDIYSADGQLKGHVEPPDPIKNYLGEANWWFRDSNWDPDFPTSAQRAEWFLDKETDQNVDGVVALDLEVVKALLTHTGPIFLPDYNMEISSENLYEKTQEEVHANFFPGTRKKASFLTALTRSLIFETQKVDNGKKARILTAVVENLQSRHIQTFLHNDAVQNAFSKANWSGAILEPSCGDFCYQDTIGLVEANVGVNKANYFIKRNLDLSIHINGEIVSRTLTVNFENTANKALGPSGEYKTYLRVIAPKDTEAVRITSVNGFNQEELVPEVTTVKKWKEIGALIEILPGESGSVIFSWRNTTPINSQTDSYGLYIRKQAGVTNDAWKIEILGDNLTNGAQHGYNLILAKDIFKKISF